MVDVSRKIPCTPLSVTLHTVCASFQTRTVATTLLYTPRTSPGNIFSADGRSCSDGHMAPMMGILWYWEGSWCMTVDQSLLLIWFTLLYLREISIRLGYRKIAKKRNRSPDRSDEAWYPECYVLASQCSRNHKVIPIEGHFTLFDDGIVQQCTLQHVTVTWASTEYCKAGLITRPRITQKWRFGFLLFNVSLAV